MPEATPDAREPALVRWLFLLFVAAIPLEVPYLTLLSGKLSVTRLAGLPFAVCYLWYHGPWPGRRPLPRPVPALGWMAVYVAAFVITGLTGPPDPLALFLTRLTALLQVCAFLWVLPDLLADAALARCALLAYALAAAAWALGILLRIPALAVTYVDAGTRLTSLQFDPNFMAIVMALGTVMLLGVRLDAPASRRLVNAGLLALTLPLLAVVAATGSRTAAVALGCGLAVYLLPARAVRRAGLTSLWVSLGAAVLLLVLIMGSSALGHWKLTGPGVQLRTRIVSAAVEMALERPLLGWGVGYMEELGLRTGRVRRNAHNLVAEAFVETGLVGAVPFLVGVALCARGALRRLSGPLGRIPLALTATLLVASMAVPLVHLKSFWLVLALGAARDADRG